MYTPTYIFVEILWKYKRTICQFLPRVKAVARLIWTNDQGPVVQNLKLLANIMFKISILKFWT